MSSQPDAGQPADLKDVFLCHSKKDVEWVHKLAERLEQEEWQGRRLRVGLDDWDVVGGKNVILQLSDLLQRSRFVAVVLSPELTTSEFCAFEWTSAVYDDPAGVRGRVLPLVLRKTDLSGRIPLDVPYALRHLTRYDFSQSSQFEREYTRLTCRIKNEPLPRGLPRSPGLSPSPSGAAPITVGLPFSQDAPDPQEEFLFSNLLPVTVYPTTIWSAPTAARKRSDIWAAVPPEARRDVPPFILREGRLFSFCDLDAYQGPLSPFFERTGIRTDPAGAWRADDDKWRWYIDLMRTVLTDYCRGALHLGLDKEKGRFFFLPTRAGGARVHEPYQGARSRTVAKPCQRPDGTAFWVHHGCRLRFETIEKRLFLQVSPCWMFTHDGFRPITGAHVNATLMKWSAHERNGAILRHIAFWGAALSRGHTRIKIPVWQTIIEISAFPTVTQTDVGIFGDWTGIRSLIRVDAEEINAVAGAMAVKSEEEGEQDDVET